MKRFTTLLFLGLVLAGTAWVAHYVWAQAAAPEEKTYSITQSQLDKYVKDQVDKAVAAEREKAAGSSAGKPVTDEQVLKAENWHRAVFNKAEYVVYTGPGQAMFHHWVEPAQKPAPGKGTAAPPAPKAN